MRVKIQMIAMGIVQQDGFRKYKGEREKILPKMLWKNAVLIKVNVDMQRNLLRNVKEVSK